MIAMFVAAFLAPKAALAGEYTQGYERALGRYGFPFDRLGPKELERLDILRRYKLVVVAHLHEGLSEEAAGALAEFVRAGGVVVSEINAFPPRNLVEGRRVTGWAPNVEITRPHPEFLKGLERGEVLRYGAWGGAIVGAKGPGVEVLARYTLRDFKPEPSKPLNPAFEEGPPAILLIRHGRGFWLYLGPTFGMFRQRPKFAGVLRGIVGATLGKEPLWRELLELERLKPPVERDPRKVKGRKAAVFGERGFPTVGLPGDVTPEFVASALREAGIEADILGVDEVSDPEVLSPQRYAVLILGHGEAFPLRALPALKRYLAAGGGLVSPAGLPLSHIVKETPQGWLDSCRDEDLRRAAVRMVFRNLLPIPKWYRPPRKPTGCVLLRPDILPGLPSIWPFGPEVCFHPAPIGTRSQHVVLPVLVAHSDDGAVCGVALFAQAVNEKYPASRFLFLGFRGERHPWSPSAWPFAKRCVVETVKWCMERRAVAIEDLAPDRPCYRPGEAVGLVARIWSALPERAIVKLTIRERTGRVLRRERREVSLRPLSTTEVRFGWRAPKGEGWLYDAILEVECGSLPKQVERAAILVWDRKPRPGWPKVEFEGKVCKVDNEDSWLIGANPYTNDPRGIGAFFDTMRPPKRPLPSIWERDLSILRLTGGNAVRQHYLEHLIGPESFERPEGDRGLRILDAYSLLAAELGMVNLLDPFTFDLRRNLLRWWGRRHGGDPLTEEEWLRDEERYLEGLARRTKCFPNVCFEIANEPEGYGREARTAEERRRFARNVKAWVSRTAKALRRGGARVVAMGLAHAAHSPVWSPKTTLDGLDYYHIHIYSPDLNAWSPRYFAPFGLNFGRPCLVGEFGMPNAANSGGEVELRGWAEPYDRMFAFVVAERGLGLTNFYLIIADFHPDSPEWGVLFPDLTEKPAFLTWKKWAALCQVIERGRLLPPDVALVYSPDGRLEDPSAFERVARAYLALLKMGIRSEVCSPSELGRSDFRALLLAPGQRFTEAEMEAIERAAGRGARVLELRLDGGRLSAEGGALPDLLERRLRVEEGPVEFSYLLPERDGGFVAAFVGERGRGGRVVARLLGRRLEFRLPPGRAALVEVDGRGRPRAVKAFGTFEVDGRALVEAPEGLEYAVISLDRRPVEESEDLTIVAEPQEAVRVAHRGPLPGAIEGLGEVEVVVPEGGGPLLEEAGRALVEALKARGIRARLAGPREGKPTGNAVLVGRPEENPLVSEALGKARLPVSFVGGPLPGVVVGRARMLWPTAGLVIWTSNPWSGKGKVAVVAGATDAGTYLAALKLSRMALCEPFVNHPWFPLRALRWWRRKSISSS